MYKLSLVNRVEPSQNGLQHSREFCSHLRTTLLHIAPLHLSTRLARESPDDFCGNVEEEDGSDEGEREDNDDEGVTAAHVSLILMESDSGVDVSRGVVFIQG